MAYVTTRDIVIPAGTRVDLAAKQTVRSIPFASAIQAMTKDSTAEFCMPLDEALEQGLIRPA